MPSDNWYSAPGIFQFDSNGNQIGLNWPLIQDHFLRTCSPDELTAQVRKMKIPAAPAPAKPANTLSEKTITLICDYYTVGNKIPWIATELGVAEATVRKYLVERKVYVVGRDRSRGK